jgi:type VI secretion system protein ImpA
MDFELLVRPLAGSSGPCGEEMGFSTEFDAIQEARRFDDPSLSQGDWITNVKEADWGKVVQICEELLTKRTKDIRVAVWLTEALTKTRGFAGMADGYTSLNRLCQSLWPVLHPLPEEEGDMEARIGSLDWLVTQSVRLIREIHLTRSASGSFSYQDLVSAKATALAMDQNPSQAEEIEHAARVTMAQFESARRDTPGSYFVTCMDDAERAKVSIEALKLTLDDLLGNDSPVFGGVFDALAEVHSTLRRYAIEAGSLAMNAARTGSIPAEVQEEGEVMAASSQTVRQPVSGPIQTREHALRQLNEIAAFFKRTEPHSPVAYLAEKAAKWGNMPLHEWLRSVVKDDSALLRVEELLGVNPPMQNDDSGY